MNVWTACRDGGWRGSEGRLGAASWLFTAVAVNQPDRTALAAFQFHSPPADEDVQHHDRTGPHRPEPTLYFRRARALAADHRPARGAPHTDRHFPGHSHPRDRRGLAIYRAGAGPDGRTDHHAISTRADDDG